MSKRAHEELEEELGGAETEQQPIKKHTLDSDEEDDVDSKKYNVMDPDDIEGEEDDTIQKDGDIQITPFNMKEEMTEGHFDAEGNYFWKKEVEIRDAWLDNIDDTKQYHDESKKNDESDDGSDDEEPEAMKDSDKAAIYEQMLELLQPKESVTKALRRLGGNKSRHSASARWRQKRKEKGAAGDAAAAAAEDGGDSDKMDRLTGLADQLLSGGNMEVYQMTREAVQHQLEQLRRPVADRLQGATDDDALDMFGDSFDQQSSAAAGEKPEAGQQDAAPAGDGEKNGVAAPDPTAGDDAGDSVSWEFKWESAEDAEIHGPHTSAEMNAWSESGYFNDAVLVRKVGTANFYQVKRVDFEIYM